MNLPFSVFGSMCGRNKERQKVQNWKDYTESLNSAAKNEVNQNSNDSAACLIILPLLLFLQLSRAWIKESIWGKRSKPS